MAHRECPKFLQNSDCGNFLYTCTCTYLFTRQRFLPTFLTCSYDTIIIKCSHVSRYLYMQQLKLGKVPTYETWRVYFTQYGVLVVFNFLPYHLAVYSLTRPGQSGAFLRLCMRLQTSFIFICFFFPPNFMQFRRVIKGTLEIVMQGVARATALGIQALNTRGAKVRVCLQGCFCSP